MILTNTTARNNLGLVSFLLSLVFPVALLLNIIATGLLVTGPLGGAFNHLAGLVITYRYWLDLVGVVALFTAIVTGHLALRRSRQYPSQQARRGLALTGLVVGYLDLALFLLLAAGVIWLLTHPIRFHIVY